MNLAERYEILEVIARGNMGVVYRARDRRLGRKVALKRILGGESEHDRARFFREAQIVARLSHPHIVALHAYGEEEGDPWLALEHVEGETLTERVRRLGRLSPEATVEFGAALAEALDHAHEAGVLHRDLKPDNVLISSEGHPFLVDFGLARLVSRATRLTASQDLIGTPAYMAPEQALGDHEHVGAPSDVYGLAATLYFAVSGQAPIIGSTLLDTLQKITSVVPAPAGSGSRQLDAALARGLAKDPAQRFSSGALFAEALRASGPRASSGTTSVAGPARRRWPAAVLLLLAALAGPLAYLLATSQDAQESDPTSLAESSPSTGASVLPASPTSSSAAPSSPSPVPSPPRPSQARDSPREPSGGLPLEPSGGLPPAKLPPLGTTPAAAALQIRELGTGLRLREAYLLLQQARAKWASDPELAVWTTAWLHARLGSWSATRKAFEEAAALDPKRLAELCRLPGDPRLYPYGPDLRRLAGGSSNPLLFESRWTPWLGGRWRDEGQRVLASQLGFGTYNLSVALDELAPRAPKEVEVEVNLAPTGKHGRGFAGIFLAGQDAREFFCLFLVDSPGDEVYRQIGGVEAYRKKHGTLPIFARMTHQHGERWEFPLRYSQVVPQTRDWLRLRAVFQGTSARVFIGGAEVATVELGRAPTGRFGLLKFYDVPIEFRAWKIR